MIVGRILLGLAAALALAACSTPGSVKPGQDEAAVRSTAGQPTGVIKLPGGATRWQYSGQPYNQTVWNIDFDGQGRVSAVEQVMTDTAFARIRSGRDTRNEVLRDFGPPAETFSYPMKNETAWMYRYFIQGGFYAAMFIYFDPAGVVKRTETGTDPGRERDGDRR
jgi:outer membrane protein assembly factor BamE (lipoprotein component of BamABCDE complex)